jgi:hypothetical protein
VTLEFLGGDGHVLRRMSNLKPKDAYEQPPEWTDREAPVDTIPAEKGANRFAWDFRAEDPTPIPGAFYADDGPKGPVVAPGDYQVRLTARGKSETAPLEVVLDPRLRKDVTDQDLAELHDLQQQVWTDIDALHRAVNQIRDTRARLDTLRKWSGDSAAAKPVVAAADAVAARLDPIEGRLMQVQMKASEDNLRYPNMLNEQYDTFSQLLDGSDYRPTQPQREVFAYLHAELTAELAKWRAVVGTELPAIDALMRQHGVPSLTDLKAP